MNKYMEIAYKEALKCKKTDDVPVGTVIVENEKIISKGHNTREKRKSIIGHAEINAVEKACKKKKTWHLDDCVMYVTLEPCKMCIEVIKQARIKKIYYASAKTKNNSEIQLKMIKLKDDKHFNKLLSNFFKNKRNIEN